MQSIVKSSRLMNVEHPIRIDNRRIIKAKQPDCKAQPDNKNGSSFQRLLILQKMNSRKRSALALPLSYHPKDLTGTPASYISTVGRHTHVFATDQQEKCLSRTIPLSPCRPLITACSLITPRIAYSCTYAVFHQFGVTQDTVGNRVIYW
jgi:hypothetical protein